MSELTKVGNNTLRTKSQLNIQICIK